MYGYKYKYKTILFNTSKISTMTSQVPSWRILVLCFLFVAVLHVCSPQPHAEIEKRFSSWRFQKAFGSGMLSPILRKISIPNVCKKSGGFKACVSSMGVSSVGNPIISAHWDQSSSTVGLAANIGHVTVKGKWNFKLWIFRDSGRFALTLKRINFALIASLRNSNRLVIKGCTCRVNSSKLRLRGGGSWLYKYFTGTAERAITRFANNKFCKNSCNKLKGKTIRL